jgi:hypothetical protein
MAELKSRETAVTDRVNEILERGDIYFLYRPRAGAEEAHGLKDVERFYIVLKPWRSREYRLIIVGRKRLPDPEEHNRFWAFVYRVFKDMKELNEELGEQEYETKTHGVRNVAAVRPAAAAEPDGAGSDGVDSGKVQVSTMRSIMPAAPHRPLLGGQERP